MNLRTVMQVGPAKANELFAKLSETSDGAVKTREKLFTELKAELELHASLEEQHLFPILRRNRIAVRDHPVPRDNPGSRLKVAGHALIAPLDHYVRAKIRPAWRGVPTLLPLLLGRTTMA
jgi:hypothetical protein